MTYPRRVATGLIALGLVGAVAAPAPSVAAPRQEASVSSVVAARQFLYRMMDLHASGTVPRLVQSFAGGWLGAHHFTASETYDDALIIHALLADGTSTSLERARVIGNALLYVQQYDPAHDGRIRAAYAPAALTSPAAVEITGRATDVGNLAWVGLALGRLAAVTADRRYLTGAEAIGTWIDQHTRDTRAAGGFTGGYTATADKIRWKSTEHNIDAHALFRLLAKQTGAARWGADAAWARQLIVAMWQPGAGYFAVGTDNDGRTINHAERVEDVNSWSYLALQDPAYAASIDWNVAHLSVSGPGYAGVSFCAGDTSGAWYEGTAHLAAALTLRGAAGDDAAAARYLADIRAAQQHGPNTDGQGIIAASKDRLSDCDGDFYYSSLHTGATAWFILAVLGTNPFAPTP